jgi:peptidoglycan/LPS O-acetylase OafA/YrhL
VYFAWQWKPAHLLYLVHLGNYIPFLSPNPEFQTTAAAVRSGLGRHMGTFPYLALGTFWSLCVEEQFYLLWPSVMFSRLSRQALLRICLAALPATMMLRLLLFLFAPHVFITRNLLYSFTCTRVDSFLIGGALGGIDI